jgi:hypothetical protein
MEVRCAVYAPVFHSGACDERPTALGAVEQVVRLSVNAAEVRATAGAVGVAVEGHRPRRVVGMRAGSHYSQVRHEDTHALPAATRGGLVATGNESPEDLG